MQAPAASARHLQASFNTHPTPHALPRRGVVHGPCLREVPQCSNVTCGDAWKGSWGGDRLNISVAIQETVSGIVVPYRINPMHAQLKPSLGCEQYTYRQLASAPIALLLSRTRPACLFLVLMAQCVIRTGARREGKGSNAGGGM